MSELTTDRQIYIHQLCEMLAPCDAGEPIFDKWVAADFGGKGTSCGFLVHRVRYAVGERTHLVNASLPGCSYRPGENISLIWNQGRSPSVAYKTDTEVPRCSILFVTNGPPVTEHVEILDEVIDNGDGSETWVVWAAGQQNEKGRECMRKKHRTRQKGSNVLSGRRLLSIIPPDNLRCTEKPLDLDELALTYGVLDRPARDAYTGKPL